MTRREEFIAIFPYLDSLLSALRVLRGAQVEVRTVFSPVPHHEIQEALGLKPSPVRYFTLLGGMLGLVSGLALAVYTVLQWNFIVGGKPVVAWVPFVVVGFEVTILFGVLSTIGGLLILSRMPRWQVPSHYDPRFTEDRFGILVACGEGEKEKIFRLLRESGAEEIREVR